MTDSPPPLAEQTRRPGWWLGALARSPLLIPLIVLPAFASALIWTLWQPPEWVRLPIGLIVIGPILQTVKDFRERRLRALEQGDEAAERTGRRRPLGAPDPQTHPATFTWHSPTGRWLVGHAAVFAVLTGIGGAVVLMMTVDQPPQTLSDDVLTVLLTLVFLSPALFGWLIVGGVRRSIRRVLAAEVRPVLMDVIGTDPRTRAWVLQPAGGESPSVVHLLGGRHLLVAGDEVLARGPFAAPARNWRRVTPVLFAVTGPFGTLWAQHRT